MNTKIDGETRYIILSFCGRWYHTNQIKKMYLPLYGYVMSCPVNSMCCVCTLFLTKERFCYYYYYYCMVQYYEGRKRDSTNSIIIILHRQSEETKATIYVCVCLYLHHQPDITVHPTHGSSDAATNIVVRQYPKG